ncbi:uncharacterized protein M6B38_321460 [Iris pallida]|uniref:Uncharacterized protein n=1 Tax=Iris pallida TaxID=29817 RepID=A0AAX6HD81_IRIPA|nr:uncharacterized protein M6B38_321460 [Iris pallida]
MYLHLIFCHYLVLYPPPCCVIYFHNYNVGLSLSSCIMSLHLYPCYIANQANLLIYRFTRLYLVLDFMLNSCEKYPNLSSLGSLASLSKLLVP